MLQIGIKSDVDKLIKKFDDLANRQIPFATSLALNNTAKIAKDSLYNTMQRVFHNPKPYTLNSLFIDRSTKRDLRVTVGHKKGSPVNQYLQPEIFGGLRQYKEFERLLNKGYALVPGQGLKLDVYGNPNRAQLKQIVQALRGNSSAGNQGIFVIYPGAASHLRPGVYQRYGRTIKVRGRTGSKTASQFGGVVKALMLFHSTPVYHQAYDFYGVIERTFEAEFGKQFAYAMDYALSTAKINL